MAIWAGVICSLRISKLAAVCFGPAPWQVNTFLGESWEDAGEQVDDYAIANRRETYGSQVPAGVVVLTAGVDVQDDRLEVEVLGHGRDEESWSIKWPPRLTRGHQTPPSAY